EVLIPPMMQFTADFTIAALQLTGLPVYREALYFYIPSGSWRIVEGCSGLRYLIASVALGCLYAYLTFHSIKRRLLFIAASIIVPVIANGLRAYMIVMIAHLSGMKLALGVDHYIYGWVFFGVVMLLLFWVGSFWREDDKPGTDATNEVGAVKNNTKGLGLSAVLAVIGVTAVWPAYAAYLEHNVSDVADIALRIPAAAGGWQLHPKPVSDWEPRYLGTDTHLMQTYTKNGHVVSLYLGYYRHQRQGAELINSQNIMIRQKHPVWGNIGEIKRKLDEVPFAVRQTRLRSPDVRLLVWDWFWIAGQYTIDPRYAKLLEARQKLLQRPDDDAAIIISAPYDEKPELAAEVIREYIRDMLPSIEASLHDVAHR
ncbi:MAG: exosortase A, partial [Burkholderiales bacterium]